MASMAELLKEAENSIKKGWEKGAWFPHESYEGGPDTLAYGHKLTQEEHDGRYVVLPDGTVVDFDSRGLTEEEAVSLFKKDVATKRAVAKSQWDSFVAKDYADLPSGTKKKYDEDEWETLQGKSFDSIDPMQQSLLTEIAFNVGGLRNSSNNFDWPSLAKAISSNDVEGMKKEIMRSAPDAKTGGRKELTKRVNSIRDIVDLYYKIPEGVDLSGFSDKQASPDTDTEVRLGEEASEAPPAPSSVGSETLSSVVEGTSNALDWVSSLDTEGFLKKVADYVEQNRIPPSSPSKEPTEGVPATDKDQEEGTQWTEQEKAFIDSATNRPSSEESEETPPESEIEWTEEEREFISRATGVVETEEPVFAEVTGESDASRDPTYGIF